MVKALCVPCAEDLKTRGKKVIAQAGRREKITCAACKRRRYGLRYEVTGRVKRSAAKEA